ELGMNFSRQARGTNGFGEPCEVIAPASLNRQRDNFRHVVTMQLLDRALQCSKSLARRFYDQERFLRGLNLVLPAIDRTHRNLKNIHARRQPLLHERTGDSPGLLRRTACHQHDDLIRHDSPLSMRLYSSDYPARDSCVLSVRGPRYNSPP